MRGRAWMLLGRGRSGFRPGSGDHDGSPVRHVGNTTVFGRDDGLFTPTGGEPTALGVAGSPTLDLTVSGTGTAADPHDITGAVIQDQVNVAPAR
ncbi:hypothetical protein ABZV67_40915 [Streptomyces sp. NPDC005065]|uniref:hypothetical protein n=1 Tax=Streptomyces sp. NPDC005065 TaxID=3154461 RepID=UPI0033AE3BFD